MVGRYLAVTLRSGQTKEEAYKAVSGPVLSDGSGKNNRQRFYFQVGDATVLLAFLAKATLKGDQLPVHGATGPGHFAYQQSELMNKELTRKGVEHELLTVKNAGHGLAVAKASVIADVRNRAVAFL